MVATDVGHLKLQHVVEYMEEKMSTCETLELGSWIQRERRSLIHEGSTLGFLDLALQTPSQHCHTEDLSLRGPFGGNKLHEDQRDQQHCFVTSQVCQIWVQSAGFTVDVHDCCK